MMRTFARTLLPILLIAAIAGCSGGRIEDTEGGVLLTVTNFDGLPTVVGVNASAAGVSIGTLTLTNSPKNARGGTSSLMDIQIQTYEVTYDRIGAGTRAPSTLIRDVIGFAPIDGTAVINNLPIMTLLQLDNPPLSDLQFANGGFDRETNTQVITLNLTLTFFGRTIAGDNVASEPVSFTVDFVP